MSDAKERILVNRKTVQFEGWQEIGCRRKLAPSIAKPGPLNFNSLLHGDNAGPKRIRHAAKES